jgi:F0F1-type ATP synthase assembly protein I
MALIGPPSEEKKDSRPAAHSMYLVIPGIMVAAPLIGFLAGQWADKKFGTDPWLLIAGLMLGFAAAGREIYKLVQKVQSMEGEGDDK